MIATSVSTTISSARYRFTGTSQGVQRAVDALFRRYPPEGYGTHKHPRIELPDGRVSVDVTLSNSCD